MATLTYQTASINGAAYAAAAASAGGDKVAPSDRGAVLVLNGSASPITVTVATPGNTKYGQAVPDIPITVPASSNRLIGPFPSDLADPTDGLVAITYSAVTTVTVAAIQV